MFDQQHPHLSAWILSGDGWIELGQDDSSRSTVRILDIGGMIWESDESYTTVTQALAAAEVALAAWVEKTHSPAKTDFRRLARNDERWYAARRRPRPWTTF